jgi:hypothetical protein
MSPSKKRKLEKDASSTPHPPVHRRKMGVASISDDHTSTPVKRFTRQTRPISESDRIHRKPIKFSTDKYNKINKFAKKTYEQPQGYNRAVMIMVVW